MKRSAWGLAVALLVSVVARGSVAQELLYSFEDATTEGWITTFFDTPWEDKESILTAVPGPGNSQGSYSLQNVGRTGGFVRNNAVFLDADRIAKMNQAVLDGWNIAFDWTIKADENPGAQFYLSQLVIAHSGGWSQLDMNDRNGYPVWDPAGPNIQTLKPSIPLADFGGGTLGYWGPALDGNSETYLLSVTLSSGGETGEKRTYYIDNIRVEPPKKAVVGDFNQNGLLDSADIDDLTTKSASNSNPADYDLDGDQLVNDADVNVWAKNLFKTYIGDANLDGEFNSTDLINVLASGKYETDSPSVWSTGDFTGDGRTNSGDLVAALVDGGYEKGPRAAVAAVPEPNSLCLLLIGSGLGLGAARRRRS
jgi:hypothetical protein